MAPMVRRFSRGQKVKYILGLSLASFLAVGSVWAQTGKVTVRFDPASTQIGWTLHGNTHTTHGTFKLKSGMVTFDPATGVAEGELLVDLASGETGNKKRDAKMQNEVLQSDKYPEAFFHPIRIAGAVKPGAAQSVTAEGSFNIHGADHPLKLQVLVKLDGGRATATTRFTVPYVAWGMKDPSEFLLRVDKQVEVDVVAHGTVNGNAAP